MADARVAAIDATASLQNLTKISPPRHPWDDKAELDLGNQIKGVSAIHSSA
jgi:hypothetical protein